MLIRSKRPLSLTALLLLVLCVVIAPIAGLLGLSYFQTKARAQAGLELIARGSVARAETVLANVEGILKGLVERGQLSCSDADREIYAYLVYAHIEIRSIGMVDVNQQMVLCTDSVLTNTRAPLINPALVLGSQQRQLAIEPPRKDVLGETSVFASYRADDKTLAFAAIYPEQFWDFQDALGLGEGGAVMLLDKKGNEIANLRDSSNIKPPDSTKIPDGYARVAGFYSVAESSGRYPIRAVGLVSVDTVMRDWRRNAMTFLPISLIASGLGMWIVWRNLRRTQPLSGQLLAAIGSDELTLVYQPIVVVSNPHRIIAVEALTRWTSWNLGEISPERFVSEAVRDGCLPQLSAWVFRQCARDLRPFLETASGFRVSINIGVDDLTIDGPLSKAMNDYRELLPHFMFEITERDPLMNQIDAVNEVLAHWRSLGVQIALDDFGTGCCNLAYLRLLPIDVVKIDRIFSATLDSESEALDTALFDSVRAILKQRKLSVIVEGIEREAQHKALEERGVTLAQGWHYARPMSLSALESHFALTQQLAR